MTKKNKKVTKEKQSVTNVQNSNVSVQQNIQQSGINILIYF